MARNGSDVYSKPAGTTAVTATTVNSAKFNEVIDDIAADLNTPRPIVAGGTGSSTASTARTALGVAIGSDVLAYNAEINDLAGITDVIKRLAIGDTPPVIGNAGVVDNSIDPGPYGYSTSASSSGGPTGVTSGNLIHMRRAAGGGEAQFCIPDGPASHLGRLYYRARLTGVWSDWQYALNDGDFLDEDDMSSDDAEKVPSQQSVKAYVDGEVGSRFDSPATALPGGAILATFAHGLGAVPKRIQVTLICTSTDVNFASGLRVACPSAYYDGTKTVNANVSADATNIYVHWAANTLLVNTSSGGATTLDAAKWDYVATAWSA